MMKKKTLFRATIVGILLLIGVLPGVHAPLTGAAPPLPVSPTPTSPPMGPVGAGESLHTPPSPDDLSPKVEQARARQAIEAALEKYLRYWGPRYQVAPIEVRVEGEWAHGVAKWQNQARTVSGPIHILAHRLTDGAWQALLPSTDGLYLQWLDVIPESLVPASEKSRLRAQAAAADTLRRPRATPVVPTAVATMPPSEKRSRGTPRAVPGPAQPWATSIPPIVQGSCPPANCTAGRDVGRDFFAHVLERLADVPMSDFAVDALVQWEPYENTSACWNPLATTWYMEGSCNFNSVGVKHYLNQDMGTQATANTLAQSYYDNIRRMLRLEEFNREGLRHDLRTWGTCSGQRCDSLLNQWKHLWDAAHGGGGADNTPPDGDYSEPSNGATVGGSVWLRAWATDDNSGVKEVHFNAKWSGDWHGLHIDPSSPYEYNWDLCAQGVPDGDIELGLHIADNAGNEFFLHNKHANPHVTKSYDCNPPPSNNPPNSPDLTDPHDWYVSRNDQAPELCWRNNGDPDGDSVEFHVEVRGAVNADSSWITSTCWRPSQLDGHRYGYQWRVEARDNRGGSTWSNQTWHFNIEGPPAAPGNLRVISVGATSVQLAWDDYSTDEDGFRIFRNGGQVGQVGSNQTSYTDTGLACNTRYTYFVKAYHSLNGESSASNSVEPTTSSCGQRPNPPVLQSPQDGAWVDEGETITFSWSGQADQFLAETTGFETYNSGWIGATSWSFQPPLPSSYLWHVKARNGAGESDWSAVRTYGAHPAAPSGLTAQALACHRVRLTWQNNSAWALGFNVYRDGSLIDSVSQDTTFFEDSSVAEDSTYTYEVKSYAPSDIYESRSSNQATVTTPRCPPADTEPPIVDWIAPVGNDEVYHVRDEVVQLEVSATDNVGVSRVWFYRWDAVNEQWVDIGEDVSSPYQMNLDSTTLNYEWNHVWAKAYDTAGIESERKGIWLYRDRPAPDLMPSQWEGWQYPVVPSSVTGTNEVNTLYAGQPTYIDWGITNAGDANTGGNSYSDLYIDNTQIAHYDFGDVGAGTTWAFHDWATTVDTPGWHTLKSVVDPDDLIAESDETNNTWEHQFFWIPSAPYNDDMESGTNDWSAGGLWHQVDGSSPYLESHSGSHSWWYGMDDTGDYDTGVSNSGDLTSPSIYIPSTGYYLRFWYWYETETQGPDWDQRWVQISVDGGPFDNVLQLLDDPQDWWLQSPAIDLSGYAGHVIQVRFHFDTIDGSFNNYRGWYIDDFTVSTMSPPACHDTHETNNTPDQATAIAYGQTLGGDICPGGDYDFYAFTGTAGDKVVVDINAKPYDSLLDSYIVLLDSDRVTVLAENDDEPTSLDSKLGYELPHDGVYYIKVRAWDHPSAGGWEYFYYLRLLTDNSAPSSVQITSPGNDAWLNTALETVTVSASDDESGINRVEFLWHDADWENSDWIWLGADLDGSDGWSWDFDTGSIAEQQGGALYIWAFDWAGNWTGAGAWGLGIDHTPPAVAVEVWPMYGDAPFIDYWVGWWDAGNDLSGVVDYDVQYRDSINGVWTDLLTGTTDTYYRFVGQDGAHLLLPRPRTGQRWQ